MGRTRICSRPLHSGRTAMLTHTYFGDPAPRCEKCGSHHKWLGSLRHPNDATQRVDLYRCMRCGDRTEVTASLHKTADH